MENSFTHYNCVCQQSLNTRHERKSRFGCLLVFLHFRLSYLEVLGGCCLHKKRPQIACNQINKTVGGDKREDREAKMQKERWERDKQTRDTIIWLAPLIFMATFWWSWKLGSHPGPTSVRPLPAINIPYMSSTSQWLHSIFLLELVRLGLTIDINFLRVMKQPLHGVER